MYRDKIMENIDKGVEYPHLNIIWVKYLGIFRLITNSFHFQSKTFFFLLNAFVPIKEDFRDLI
jgi:hypothetical protein